MGNLGVSKRTWDAFLSWFNRSRVSAVLILAALVVLYGLAVGIRKHIAQAQAPQAGVVLPFTLESALQYRLIHLSFSGEGIPRHDKDLQYPEGVRTYALDTTGAEALIAQAARLFPPSLTLAERVRWIHVLWFCLGIPLMTLWIRAETRSWLGGFGAGLLYATAVSAVVRSTGQEISHENHALPLLLAHLLAESYAAAAPTREHDRGLIRSALSSAIPLALALVTWDLIQVYTICWSLERWIRWLRRPTGLSDTRVRRDALIWLVLAAAGGISPYLRTHGFLFSPTLLLGYGVILGAALLSARRSSGHAPPPGFRWIVLAPWIPALLAASAFTDSYSHFGELLWAKIRFLNQKPVDPSLLTYAQRILWTPALHSATLPLTRFLFPAFLGLTGTAFVIRLTQFALSARLISHTKHEFRIWFLFVASLAAFVLFVRFHVFVALFGSAVVGLTLGTRARTTPSRFWVGVIGIPILAAGSMIEVTSLIQHPERAGRPRVYYDQLDELATWLKQRADRQPVLANFGVSATVLTYGECPILLHPKFEAPDIRARVEHYGRLLFGSGEEPLRAWAEERGARYLVYALGEFSQHTPEYQMRYMINALDPPADAPARLFEFNPHQAEGFRFLWGNAKYRVFRIHRADDEEEWLFRRGAAQDAFIEGQLDEAERHAEQALQLRPDDAESWQVIRKILGLRRSGFSDGGSP